MDDAALLAAPFTPTPGIEDRFGMGNKGAGMRAFKSTAHIMGVVVRETTMEIKIATDNTTANSWNSRPMIPPMSKIGMKTAMSDRLIESTVKAISLAPTRAASRGVKPASMWRVMFSSTTMASSTTKPVAMVSAIKERLFKL